MKIDFYISEEDREDIEKFIMEFEEKNNDFQSYSIESGRLKVTFEGIIRDAHNIPKKRVYVIYRKIGEVIKKIKKKKRTYQGALKRRIEELEIEELEKQKKELNLL